MGETSLPGAALLAKTEFLNVTVGLRAPRVAIAIEDGVHWHSLAALAMWHAGRCWGGAGFTIVVQSPEGAVHPALLRVLRAYDPDYLRGVDYSALDQEAMEPGWIQKNVAGLPENDEERSELVASMDWSGTVGRVLPSERLWAATSCYKLTIEPGQVHTWGPHSSSDLERSLQSVDRFAPRPTLVGVPPHNNGVLGLALGLRFGFAEKPALPFDDAAVAGNAKPLVSRAVSVRNQGPIESMVYGDVPEKLRLDSALPTVWESTMAGLGWIADIRSSIDDELIIVIGDSANDFALAYTLSRLRERVVWLPAEWLSDDATARTVARSVLAVPDRMGRDPKILLTSTSLDQTTANDAWSVLRPHWPPVLVPDGTAVDSDPAMEWSAPEELPLDYPRHLACMPDDYDISESIPSRVDASGTATTVSRLRAHLPRSPELQGQERPFWHIDVRAWDVPMVPGRGLASEVFTTAPGPAHDLARPGRSGISIDARSMGFITTGASLAQSSAQPHLRFPGFKDWISEVALGHGAKSVTISDHGNLARLAGDLFGTRSALGQDLIHFWPLWREYLKPKANGTSDAFPDHDGVQLAGDNFLSFTAMRSIIPADVSKVEIRDQIDGLVVRGVLRRGLIVGCGNCHNPRFIAIDHVGQRNECPHCGTVNELIREAWRKPHAEPTWFYQLNGIVKKFLLQNGDVPVLASGHLRAAAGPFMDSPELSFEFSDGKRGEIDLVAWSGGQLIVCEAKIGSDVPKSERAWTRDKLLRAADLLQAEQIALASGSPEPWSDALVGSLKSAVARHPWTGGIPPRIRLLTGLRPGNEVGDVLIDVAPSHEH